MTETTGRCKECDSCGKTLDVRFDDGYVNRFTGKLHCPDCTPDYVRIG